MITRRTFSSLLVAAFTAAAVFVVGYIIVQSDTRIEQNNRIIENQTELIDAIKSQAAVNETARKKSDAALLAEIKKLLKITEDVQEQTSTQNGVRVVTRTVTRTRTVCVRPNGRPC